MRYLIFFLFISISSTGLHAQVPHPGVYQFNNQLNNYFGASHYASFFNSIDDFLSMKIIPYQEVSDYGLTYAIVSANQAHTQIKIAFLRDTVSTKGKKQLSIISKNALDRSGKFYFSQEFSIQKDSVIKRSSNNNSLAGTGNLPGEWSFSKNGYDYFGIYKNPLIKNQSIKIRLQGNISMVRTTNLNRHFLKDGERA